VSCSHKREFNDFQTEFNNRGGEKKKNHAHCSILDGDLRECFQRVK